MRRMNGRAEGDLIMLAVFTAMVTFFLVIGYSTDYQKINDEAVTLPISKVTYENGVFHVTHQQDGKIAFNTIPVSDMTVGDNDSITIQAYHYSAWYNSNIDGGTDRSLYLTNETLSKLGVI